MRFLTDKEWLTYDDVLLVPQCSSIRSRTNIDLTSGKLKLKTPFISANMDTVTEENMSIAVSNCGGIGFIHRYLNPTRLKQIVQRCKAAGAVPVVSLGINGDSDELLEVALTQKVKHYCIDVAHGHHIGVIERIQDVRQSTRKLEDVVIIAGNVATREGVEDLALAGADIIKVGIGPGSHCTTRIVTGHGVPQLSALIECVDEAKTHGVEIIADGGIRNSGDIAKAIAAGANYVMLGRLLAGCDESPCPIIRNKAGDKVKLYRGMASYSAQKSRNKTRAPEGVLSYVKVSGPAEGVLINLRDGLCSALSYTAASNVPEFQEKACFIRVTHNSYIEGTPHGKDD